MAISTPTTPGQILTSAYVNNNINSGLTYIKQQTIGTAVPSVDVTNAFSSTYDAYNIVVTGGAASAATNLRYQHIGATVNGYYSGGTVTNYSTNVVSGFSASNAASLICGTTFTTALICDMTVINPFLAKESFFTFGAVLYTSDGGVGAGYHNAATSYTGFTLFPQTGTITGGTITVYGYRKA